MEENVARKLLKNLLTSKFTTYVDPNLRKTLLIKDDYVRYYCLKIFYYTFWNILYFINRIIISDYYKQNYKLDRCNYNFGV